MRKSKRSRLERSATRSRKLLLFTIAKPIVIDRHGVRVWAIM